MIEPNTTLPAMARAYEDFTRLKSTEGLSELDAFKRVVGQIISETTATLLAEIGMSGKLTNLEAETIHFGPEGVSGLVYSLEDNSHGLN